jgi:hypothetical protein
MKTFAAAFAVLLSLAFGPALADYAIKDGNNVSQTIDAVSNSGKILPKHVPSDPTGTAYSALNGFPVTPATGATPWPVTWTAMSVRMQDGSGNVLTSLSVGAQRALAIALVDSSGAQTGLSGNALRVDPTGTTTQPVSLASVPSHAVTNAGTFAVQAAQSGTWNVTNVSGTVSLPTGASTAAKQPALGTAGAPSADVITVQGAAGATAVRVTEDVSALSGGLTTVARIVSAANTTNATSAKGSAGRLYKIDGYNAAAAVRYIKIYNKATAPTVGTDTPLVTLAVAPSSRFEIMWGPTGIFLATGIAFALTTGSADADTGALTAADIVGLNLYYN